MSENFNQFVIIFTFSYQYFFATFKEYSKLSDIVGSHHDIYNSLNHFVFQKNKVDFIFISEKSYLDLS
jgi:hypothetical protein